MGKVGAVLVIGGGIAGTQASLDLADAGFKVYLVESSPSVGGNMARLDKTFPTGDCAMCTMAPKLVELVRHPNIEVLTCSEVESISGRAGEYVARIRKKPRFIREELCTGCGECSEVCPVLVPNEFDVNIGARNAIYIPHPQATPLVYTLDKNYCISCGLCEAVCDVDAIDFEQKEEIRELRVGAIIVTTGYEPFDPSALAEYGFGSYENVLTNLQFERLLSPSGPTGGHIMRPSDGREPRVIAFVQCVGSRDERHYPYCSQICCMASTKEAIVAKEHIPGLKSYIFYMDLRSFGKGFQEYVDRAKKEYGVEYIRSRVARISRGNDGKLVVGYEDTEQGRYAELEADLVVLAPALKPASGAVELARKLGIEVDEYGFFLSNAENRPLESKKGIYLAGTCLAPRDIPDSVAQASGAAAKAGVLLKEARHSLTEIPPIPAEKALSGEPRVGVFVCHCGFNIAGVVNVAKVAEYAASLPEVVYATDTMYACSSENLEKIKKAIAEHDLNRVVVAACTPRTHEFLFRKALREANLNPYLLEQVNIREHCSWVHAGEPGKATTKAMELVRMSVARSVLLEPQDRERITLTPSALVIGGGIAGMQAALDIANQGFRAEIVEQGSELGGVANALNSVFLDAKDPGIFSSLKKDVLRHPNIRVHLNSRIAEVKGYVGNFEAVVEGSNGSRAIKAGAIVLATGSEEYKPHGRFFYGEDPRVVTLLELEEKLKGGLNYRSVVMIQCVAARGEEHSYCSRTCCAEAVKNAILLKQKRRDAQVFILYRDLMLFGRSEEYYARSQVEDGIRYLRYTPANPPEVMREKGELYVQVYDTHLGDVVRIRADLLVLATPQVPPSGIEELQKMLKVSRSDDGFFAEAHAKLRPLEFSSEGIYLAGNCQAPKELPQVIAQASGAAAKVVALLSRGAMESEAITAEVDEERCIGCGLCAELCPYGAPVIEEGKSRVVRVLCKGCGICAASCPGMAISMRHFRDEQILAQVKAVVS
jgi:heterodisulfide reductase subunit A